MSASNYRVPNITCYMTLFHRVSQRLCFKTSHPHKHAPCGILTPFQEILILNNFHKFPTSACGSADMTK